MYTACDRQQYAAKQTILFNYGGLLQSGDFTVPSQCQCPYDDDCASAFKVTVITVNAIGRWRDKSVREFLKRIRGFDSQTETKDKIKLVLESGRHSPHGICANYYVLKTQNNSSKIVNTFI